LYTNHIWHGAIALLKSKPIFDNQPTNVRVLETM